VIGHSQGAAVVAEAVWRLSRDPRYAGQLDRLNVVIMGPAEWRFPPEVEVLQLVNPGDPVPPGADLYRGLAAAPGGREPRTIQTPFACDRARPVTCHDFRGYLEAYGEILDAENLGAGSYSQLPAQTIIVNGITRQLRNRWRTAHASNSPGRVSRARDRPGRADLCGGC